VVMEHKDGSGLFCLSKSPGTGKRDPLPLIGLADTSYVLVTHSPPVRLHFTSVSRYGKDRIFEFRREQLEQRRFEIYAAIDALKRLSVDGDRGCLSTIDDSELDWSDFRGKVGFDTLQLAGHSFGATTLLSLLSHEPSEGFEPLPVTHALFLDPWLEPFEKSGPVQASRHAQAKKLFLHSEAFTLWTGHIAQLTQVAKDWGNIPLYTIGTAGPVVTF
jgi:platelet-activating factor acetylhydrolase